MVGYGRMVICMAVRFYGGMVYWYDCIGVAVWLHGGMMTLVVGLTTRIRSSQITDHTRYVTTQITHRTDRGTTSHTKTTDYGTTNHTETTDRGTTNHRERTAGREDCTSLALDVLSCTTDSRRSRSRLFIDPRRKSMMIAHP